MLRWLDASLGLRDTVLNMRILLLTLNNARGVDLRVPSSMLQPEEML
jgi:hypothetical protein